MTITHGLSGVMAMPLSHGGVTVHYDFDDQGENRDSVTIGLTRNNFKSGKTNAILPQYNINSKHCS